MNTRSAGGVPGTDGQPWPCWRWRSSRSPPPPQRQQDTPSDDLIPITVNELRRLFDALVLGKTATVEHILKWSNWRRKHQATARRCHYKRRSEPIELDLLL